MDHNLMNATTQEFFRLLALRETDKDGKQTPIVMISVTNPRIQARVVAVLNLMNTLSAPETAPVAPAAPAAPTEPAAPAA